MPMVARSTSTHQISMMIHTVQRSTIAAMKRANAHLRILAIRLSGEFSEPYTKSIYGIDCTFAESETQNVVCFNIGFDSYTLNGDVSIETMEQIVQSLLTE